jgi:hypothetical protein
VPTGRIRSIKQDGAHNEENRELSTCPNFHILFQLARSENFRLPINASIFDTSNSGTIEWNQNGNGCVERIAQEDRLFEQFFAAGWNSWLLETNTMISIFHRFPKYEPRITNNARIWESYLCLVWRSSAFWNGIILVYTILMPYKKETDGAWLENGLESDEYVSSRLKRRKTRKGPIFQMIAGTFFRTIRSRHLRVIILLSEHFPEIPLLKSVRFNLF